MPATKKLKTHKIENFKCETSESTKITKPTIKMTAEMNWTEIMNHEMFDFVNDVKRWMNDIISWDDIVEAYFEDFEEEWTTDHEAKKQLLEQLTGGKKKRFINELVEGRECYGCGSLTCSRREHPDDLRLCEFCSPKDDDDDECICEEDANGNIIANKNCKEHDCCKLCSKCVKCEFNGMIWWCAVCEKDNEEDDV